MWFKPKLKLYVTIDEFDILKEMYKDVAYLDDITKSLESQNNSVSYINGVLNAFAQKEKSLLNKLKPPVKNKKIVNIDKEVDTKIIREHLVTVYHLNVNVPKINWYLTNILKHKGINKWYNLSILINTHNDAVDGMYNSVDHISTFLKHVDKLSHIVDNQSEFDTAFIDFLKTVSDIASFYKHFLDRRLKKDRKCLLKFIDHMAEEIKYLHASENN